MQGLEMAGYGVTMFFTLSGFLITYLLLLEKIKFGGINIRMFYIRRIMRIWPLYYFYLLVSLLALFIYQRDALNGNVIFYFVLLANVPFILGQQFPVIGHFWSLGVEEQFYLFWPWVVRKLSRLVTWLTVFIAVILALKLLFWFYYHRTGDPVPMSAIHITRFHCMAIGALGAVLVSRGNSRLLRAVYSPFTQVLVWGVIALTAVNKFNVYALVNDEIIAVITLLVIVNVSGNPRSFVTLDNTAMNYIGRISYGIYVYHPLVIFLSYQWFGKLIRGLETNTRYILVYLLVVFVTIGLAGLSYKFFETPFLKWKDKFARVKSTADDEKNKSLATG